MHSSPVLGQFSRSLSLQVTWACNCGQKIAASTVPGLWIVAHFGARPICCVVTVSTPSRMACRSGIRSYIFHHRGFHLDGRDLEARPITNGEPLMCGRGLKGKA